MDSLGEVETLIMLVGAPVVLSPLWFALTRSKRVRCVLFSVWCVTGVILAAILLNPYYVIGFPISALLWAGFYWILKWISVRVWRFLKTKLLSNVREI